jgi:hypothetical protein
VISYLHLPLPWWRGLNEALLAKAAKAKVLRCSPVRVDTTVVPSNVSYPTDSGLLAKAVNRIAATAASRAPEDPRTPASIDVDGTGTWSMPSVSLNPQVHRFACADPLVVSVRLRCSRSDSP